MQRGSLFNVNLGNYAIKTAKKTVKTVKIAQNSQFLGLHQILMERENMSIAQLIYFPFPLVPTEGLKIGYFGPLSQFFVFFADFVKQLPTETSKRVPFCTTYLVHCKTTIDDAFKIFSILFLPYECLKIVFFRSIYIVF